MKIMVIGGDERNFYLTKKLILNGYDARWYCAELFGKTETGKKIRDDISSFDAAVLPLPLTRDGETLNCPFSRDRISLSQLSRLLKGKTVFTSDDRISGINYFSDKRVIVDNARLTAVGFLAELLAHEKRDIMGKKALVTGFGNVSKCVCKLLSDNGVRAFVAARDPVQRHEARAMGYSSAGFKEAEKIISGFDYIVNTVPAKVFSDTAVAEIPENAFFFELSSGVPKETFESKGAYIECRGMPGKHTPKGAGEVIADFICSKLRE